MDRQRTLFLIEVALFTALAFILDNVPFLKFKIWGNGGSISLVMIPIFLIAFRWGLKGGLLAGFLLGCLKLLFGGYILNPFQVLIEYGLAFTVLGFAGIFARKISEAVKDRQIKTYLSYITAGIILGSVLRFLCHLFAGVIFWAESTPDGWNYWAWSFMYNISYMLPSTIICVLGTFLLFNQQPKALLKKAV
ncbi:energy-coupled thiamine transporter ThiT [Virgibacillus soli]|uniref:energy-coupled thiamine transporter ThiT n=1 Tax=Paracerasibacillus soli TaxID=480284 RepID=UPI0035EE54F1